MAPSEGLSLTLHTEVHPRLTSAGAPSPRQTRGEACREAVGACHASRQGHVFFLHSDPPEARPRLTFFREALTVGVALLNLLSPTPSGWEGVLSSAPPSPVGG